MYRLKFFSPIDFVSLLEQVPNLLIAKEYNINMTQRELYLQTCCNRYAFSQYYLSIRSSKYMLGTVFFFCLPLGLFSGEFDDDLPDIPAACSSNEYSLLFTAGLKYIFGMSCECLLIAGDGSFLNDMELPARMFD